MSMPTVDDFTKLAQQVANLTMFVMKWAQAQAASPAPSVVPTSQPAAPTSNSELFLGPLMSNPAAEYEWHAVVSYHMAFFTKRRREMIDREYGGWGRIDLELRGEHLFPYRKVKGTSSLLAKKDSSSVDRSDQPPAAISMQANA
ncbi:hypothetical protein DFS33DRAFT_1377805 [Desarmillaria ectypa]|nr:hypothetical protein DFS33DRAFT_1377805 [Desarmillaria ectypa]